MFPLLIRVYHSNMKYTTVKPCKLLLLLRPTGRRQPVHRSMKSDKVARPESSKVRKYSASGADQPSKSTSRSLLHSDISKDKGQRCRTQPGNPVWWPQAGLKFYLSLSDGQKKAQLLYSPRTAHKLPIQRNKSIVIHSGEVRSSSVVGHQLGLMG